MFCLLNLPFDERGINELNKNKSYENEKLIAGNISSFYGYIMF